MAPKARSAGGFGLRVDRRRPLTAGDPSNSEFLHPNEIGAHGLAALLSRQTRPSRNIRVSASQRDRAYEGTGQVAFDGEARQGILHPTSQIGEQGRALFSANRLANLSGPAAGRCLDRIK